MTAVTAKRIQESTGASIFLSKNVDLDEDQEETLINFVATASEIQAKVVGLILGSIKVRGELSHRLEAEIAGLKLDGLFQWGEIVEDDERYYFIQPLTIKERKAILRKYIARSVGRIPTVDQWAGLKFTDTATPEQIQAAKAAGLIADPPQFYNIGEEGSLSLELPIPTSRGSFWIRQGVNQ